MSEYHKIQTIFKRDMDSPQKALMEGKWTLPEFEYLANNRWEFTEKVDGTNIRVAVAPDGSVVFGGRTDNAQIPIPLIARLQEYFMPITMRQRLAAQFPEGAVLYGEGYGGKIQGGSKTYGPEQDFVLFDVSVGKWWLGREAVNAIAAQFGLRAVPALSFGTLHNAVAMAKDGFKSTWGDFWAEGIVARPVVELKTRSGARVIAKIKHRDFYNGGSDK